MLNNSKLPFIIVLFAIFSVNYSAAQPNKGKFIEGSIGYGIASPYDEFNIETNGFYLQGEYVLGIKSWFGVRPYAGVILVSGEEDNDILNEPNYSIKSNAFLIGAKIRLCAPIPWVSPYFEVGIGASIGSFETFTPDTNEETSGVLSHIPVSLGLAIGRHHSFAIEFAYYYHNSVEQFSGAFALGYSFPLDKL